MGSYKALLNSLSKDNSLRQLTDEEIGRLRAFFLKAYQDLAACCEKHGLTLMLIGGSALGAVRHHGFIPWDDDLDAAMPREDFEKLKGVFEQELGEKYVLSSPNYKENANNRFPMMMVKNTLFVEAGNRPEDEVSKIKIDLFIIENIPEGKVHRKLKGIWCMMLMAMGSYEETWEHQNEAFRNYMCKTPEGAREYRRRIRLGRLFAWRNFQQWMDRIDKACQYRHTTSLMGIPSGRGHYFGEIRSRKTFLPASKGQFENLEVLLPGDPGDYLENLYGQDYMVLPPPEKRERHFIFDIKFEI